METSRGTYLNLSGASPFIRLTLLWLIPETVVVLFILLALPERTWVLPNLPSRVLLSIALLLALELAKRQPLIAARALRMWLAVGPRMRRMTRYTGPAFPLAAIAAGVAYTAILVVRGASAPQGFDQEGGPLVSGILAFATAFVAFFIAGAAIFSELVSSPYISGLGPPFVRHPLFVSVLCVALGSLGLNIFLLRNGWNQQFLDAVFTSGILLIFSLPFLLKLFIDYTDPQNIIALYAQRLQGYVRRAVPRASAPLNRKDTRSEYRMPLREHLSLLYSIHVLGVLPTTQQLIPFQVHPTVTDHLQELARPLLNCALRAIREDRREILLASTSALQVLAKAYIRARQNYRANSDDFLGFLVVESDVLYGAALQSTNQQYTADLVGLISSIAFNTLDLTAGQLDPTANSIAAIYGNHLAGMALKAAHLNNTTAPVAAINAAGTLAVRLVEQHVIADAVFGVIEPLAKNADMVAKVPGTWPALLTQRSLYAMVRALAALQRLAIEHPLYSPEMYTENVADAMMKMLRSAFGVNRDVISRNYISGPLVGPVWQSGNVVDLAGRILHSLPSHPASERPHIVRLLADVSRILREGGLYAVPAGQASDFASAVSEVMWVAIEVGLARDNQMELDSLREFLSDLLGAAERLVDATVGEENARDFDFFLRLSPTYAFLAHFASTTPNLTLRQLLLDSVRRLLSIYTAAPSDEGRAFTRSELRRYLMMFGAWIHDRFPEDPLSEGIARAIAPDVAHWQGIRFGYGGDEFWAMGYPRQGVSGGWFIFPSRVWPNKDKTQIADALNNATAYREFADFVTSLAPHEDQAGNPPPSVE